MRSLTILLAAALGANGLFMLIAPGTWYPTVPGVDATGPLNVHFARDIGCIYLVAAAGLVWLLRDARAWPAAMAGAVWLGLHAVVHIAEYLTGHASPHGAGLFTEVLGVLLPPALAIPLIWRQRAPARGRV